MAQHAADPDPQAPHPEVTEDDRQRVADWVAKALILAGAEEAHPEGDREMDDAHTLTVVTPVHGIRATVHILT